jgi:MFS family permease
MVHSVLPLLLVNTLGASVLLVGLIDGAAEATTAVAKVFSGGISDRLNSRKPLAVAGYGLAALTKPLFPLASGPAMVLGARMLDRFAKGVRGAPRDAMVADLTPPNLRGAAFGLRQALDSVGAFAGPLAAIALMLGYSGSVRAVLWWAIVPAAVSAGLMIFAVREPKRTARADLERRSVWPFHRRDLMAFGRSFWTVTAVGSVLTLARFSEAFLILSGQAAHLPASLTPLVLVAMNLVYAAASTPAGALSDRLGRRGLLLAGIAALVAADTVLAIARGPAAVMAGAALWGLHMALTQGIFAAMVADAAPPSRRGTAFGVFNLITGAAIFASSAIAGILWDAFGRSVAFAAGAAIAATAFGAVMIVRLPRRLADEA